MYKNPSSKKCTGNLQQKKGQLPAAKKGIASPITIAINAHTELKLSFNQPNHPTNHPAGNLQDSPSLQNNQASKREESRYGAELNLAVEK